MRRLEKWVGRKLLNADELAAWARQQGFEDLVPSAWHVTTGWAPEGYSELISSPLTLRSASHRSIAVFGGLVVLQLRSRVLMCEGRRLLAESETRRSIRPHISFTPYRGQSLIGLQPYAGQLRFGPEVQERF